MIIRVNVLRYWAKISNKDYADKKITGWTAKCSVAEGEHTVTTDVTAYFTFTKRSDGDWSVKMTTDLNKEGSVICFEPVLTTCPHTATKVLNQKDPVCCIDGYTGDTVCADCGRLVNTGNPVPAEQTGHDGPLTRIAGTQRTGSCNQRGFSGFYRCGTCGEKVAGRNTGYDHSGYTQITQDAVGATCTADGYTGDKYCSHCGKLSERGRVIPAQHNDTKVINRKEATDEEPGYSGDTYCNTCGQIVAYGHVLPKKYKPTLEEVHITLTLPKIGDTAETRPNVYASSDSGGIISGVWRIKTNGNWKQMDTTDTFEAGKEYRANLNLLGNSSVQIVGKTRFYVNGVYCQKSAIVIMGKNCWHVEYDFTPSQEGGLDKYISSPELEFEVPGDGTEISVSPKVSSKTEGLTVDSACWKKNGVKVTTGTFSGNSQYSLYFHVKADTGYMLPDKEPFISGKINGEKAQFIHQGDLWYCDYRFYPEKGVDISKAVVSGVKNAYFTGKEIRQDAAVLTVNGTTVPNDGAHYEVIYTDNVMVGRATVTFRGLGSCKGEKSVNFQIYSRIGWNLDKNGWYYLRSDRSYPKSDWELIDGKYYHFDANGYMQTGWLQDKGKWYLLSDHGWMLTGWQFTGGKWYYLNPKTGAMYTGWLYQDGAYYYLKPGKGDMATGWCKVGGKYYYFRPQTGTMYTGWLYYGDNWYYLDTEKGDMKVGWLLLKGKYYYFLSSGVMVLNTTMTIDGQSYTFDGDGVCTNR